MRISDWSSDVCSSDLIDGDPVALLRPGRLQHIGEAADLRVKLAIADPPRFRLGVIRLPDDGNVVAPAFQMPVKAVGADVQHPVLEPFYAEVRLVEGPVRYLGEWLDPVDPTAVFQPEGVGIAKRQIGRASCGERGGQNG